MSRLLYIEASPRKQRSVSIRVAQAFIGAWRQANPDGQVDELDLWSADLPAFDQDMLDAKYAVMRGDSPQGTQVAAWNRIERLADRFKAADLYLFSVPMWNFSLPYVLKHYFDLLIQPGITFAFSPEDGYSGLVTGRRAVLAYARGGAYSEGTGMEDYDLQTRLLEQLLGFIGVTEVERIVAEPMLAGKEIAEPALEQALRRAQQLA